MPQFLKLRSGDNVTLFIGLLYGLQDDAILSAQKPYLLSFSKQSYGGVKIR